MPRAIRISTLLVLLGLSAASRMAVADVRPQSLISEGMVLQQGREVPVWGRADAGEKIALEFRGQQVTTIAENGRWKITLKSGPAGGPFRLTISGKNTLTFSNILVGEVWVCSGQSNMGWPLAPRRGSPILKETTNSRIRLFTVPERLADQPENDLSGGEWRECSPETAGNFSAVAYYFGKELQQTLNVPIGLIQATYGGSAALSWVNPAALESPDLKEYRQVGVKSVLYNGMIAPLVSYGIRGVIWYQGEADRKAAAQYQKLFTALIQGWRSEWEQGDFPFLFVQLAPFGKIVQQPRESDLAELREAQRLTSLSVPQTGMAVSTDCGHETNIHPLPKQPVGERLARLARALVYEQKLIPSGPAYSNMQIAGNKIILDFHNVGAGLETRRLVLEDVAVNPRTGETGGALHVAPAQISEKIPLQGFTIAGQDGRFVTATAEIHGEQVIVTSAAVPRPMRVRYGWADYVTGNLFNTEGLPAAPFQTSSAPGD